jgi:3D (Asp-Asp-Asp) domain-containing protein
MTRFIFSLMMVFVIGGFSFARANQDTKHPTSSFVAAAARKTAAIASSTVSAAAKAVAALDKAASMSADAVDAEMAHAAKKVEGSSAGQALGNRLARLTAYWCGEDHYTRAHLSATGVRLHAGHCAVDPSVIPFGSIVQVEGLGTFLAVDTGSDVVSRKAAKESGHSKLERRALVIDLFFEHRSEGERFAADGPKFASITWWPPHTVAADISEVSTTRTVSIPAVSTDVASTRSVSTHAVSTHAASTLVAYNDNSQGKYLYNW